MTSSSNKQFQCFITVGTRAILPCLAKVGKMYSDHGRFLEMSKIFDAQPTEGTMTEVDDIEMLSKETEIQ